MTVRRGRVKSGVMVTAAIALPLLVTGCATSPTPELDWDVKTAHRVAPKPKPRPYYAAENPRPYCSCEDNVPVPSARPNPAWYQPSQRPSRTEQAYADPNARFIWPVRGRVLAEYGATTGGERNDGINIAAAPGTPIYAAADGNVSYSGNELRNYGNLLLVRHDNGYVTAYAHADYFVVGKGERVTKGEVIGYVGQTGDVHQPQIHFELRRGARGETPVNPRQFLGPLQVARSY